MEIHLYFYLNDNYIELVGLTDVATGAFVNTATVSTVLKDKLTGAEIAGQTWPLSMPYVASSNGLYRATLKDSLTVTLGQELVAEVTVNAGTDRQGFWFVDTRVERRT